MFIKTDSGSVDFIMGIDVKNSVGKPNSNHEYKEYVGCCKIKNLI